MDYLYILIGFAILIAGANFFINGASGLAKRFNVSNLFIGLTVVAFGTSAPELVVNTVAALNPLSKDIALTNIIGSNMINVYVILGISALIYPVLSQKSSRIFDIPLSILAPFVVFLLAIVFDYTLSRLDGLILLTIFCWFMYVLITKSLRNKTNKSEDEYKPLKIWKAIILIIAGLVGLIGGAQLIVPSATNIATSLGVSQATIGLTIVALGTSLPELATSAVAAFKKNSDIALGNIIGSNIFNIFFILGTSALIRPLDAYKGMATDLLIVALGSILVLVFIYTNKSYAINRFAGGFFLFFYSGYLYWMLTRI